MFARLVRLPLRRSLHTAATAAPTRAFRRPAFALVAGSTLAAGYLTWRFNTHPVALDSEPETRPVATQVHTEPLLEDPAEEPKVPEAESDEGSDEPTDGEPTISKPTPAPTSGAYNPETGEINWDCPCLGGMADGPCGPEFKEAFSCFIFSEVEPKGIDCVEKFQAMQTCFRAHPEVYANGTHMLIHHLLGILSLLTEIMDDDDDDEPAPADGSNVPPSDTKEDIAGDEPSPAHTPQLDTQTSSSPSSSP